MLRTVKLNLPCNGGRTGTTTLFKEATQMILDHELKADFNASRYIEVLGRSECLRVLSVDRLSRLKSTFTGGGEAGGKLQTLAGS